MNSSIFIRDYLLLSLYGIALIFSIFRYSKYFDSILKYLPILIGYTLLNELLGLLIKNNEEFAIIFSDGFSYYNALIYNIFDIFFFIYFLYIYWKVLKGTNYKKWIKYGVIIFIVVSLINPFYQSIIFSPQIYSMIIGSFFLTSSAFLYLKQLNSSESKKRNDLLFWITVGLLIFYPFYSIIFIIVIYFDNSIYQSLHIEIFHQALLCLMYACFIIGFLKMHRMKPINDDN